MRTRAELVQAAGIALGPDQRRIDLASMLATAAADPRFAEHEVGEDPEQRDGNDDDDPGEARRWLAVRPQKDADQDGDVGDDQQRLGGRREVERQAQPRLRPTRRIDRPPNRPPPSHL